jgi:hypothetical protein
LVETATNCRLKPVARNPRVAQCLLRREGLRADDEQCRARIDLLEHFGEPCAVDVGDTVQADRAVSISAKRLRDHDDAEVGAADPDVHDVGVAGAAVTGDPAFVYPHDEIPHASELVLHRRHDVAPLDRHRTSGAVAQRHVHGGAMLGHIDRFPGEQRRNPFLESAGARKLDQKRQGVPGQPLPTVVEQQVERLEVQGIETCRFGVKQVAQMRGLDLRRMRPQRLPGGQGRSLGHGSLLQ